MPAHGCTRDANASTSANLTVCHSLTSTWPGAVANSVRTGQSQSQSLAFLPDLTLLRSELLGVPTVSIFGRTATLLLVLVVLPLVLNPLT